MNKTIIDGIDVSKCKFYESLGRDIFCFCTDLRNGNMPFGIHCENYKDCYFKQRERTKQEVEKWKHQAELGSDTTDRLSKELEDKNQEIEELKAQVDEWKENCNNNFELVAIRTKLLTDIAIKLGLNTAIIERKDVFDKIDKLQSKEQLSVKQSHELIRLRKELQENRQRKANLLQENEELKVKLERQKDYTVAYKSYIDEKEMQYKQNYQAKEQEVERLKKENQYHINSYCHFKNEIKKYKKAVHKYKVVLQDKIKRLHLSRREFFKEINSVPVRIACKGENFKNALNNFNNAIQVINNEDKYKQTLDEIEEFCIVYSNNHDAYETVYKHILDIINKAKDSE